jgi:signal transduction histidine kinase/CheY-like chemotaxis protein
VDLYEQRESVNQRQVATRTRERDEAIRRLVAFERIATAALETSDVRALLDELLHAFTDAAEAADSAAILLRDGDYLQVRACIGFGDEPAGGFRVRIGEGFAGRVAAERQPVELSDPSSSALIDSHWLGSRAARGLYGVPLLHGGEVLGVAQIGSTSAGTFSDAEKRLFRAAVDRAALAVTRHLELSSLYEILSVAPALIAIVRTPELRYTFTNPAYQALFDAPLGGSSLYEHHPAPRALEAVERAWKTGEMVELPELELSPAPGHGPPEPRYLAFAAHPLRNALGAVDRVLTFAVNVTTQVLARREIEATQAARVDLLERERTARRAAESASLAKDEFLATVSHELRTPLNAILGWATMARSKVVPDLDRALGIIEKSALAQARIVEDVLDFSRIARGQMRLTIANVDVPAVIRDALLAVGPAAAAKGIRIEPDIDIDDTFVCDGPRLQQVVWNLLSNAIKFSEPNGLVSIRAHLGRRELELSVKDGGQGIDADFLPYVFEAFRQAQGGSTRRHGGLGLGLAIVKEIVQAHGGTVVAGSAGLGKGAEFTLHLPLEAARRDSTPPPPSSLPRPLPPSARLDGLKILVVEDDDDSREFLAEALEQRGATIASANGVAAAIAKFEPFRPDIVVSDIAMPDADGYDLIRQIRSYPRESGGLTPALALTAHTRAEVREQARQAGFQQLEPKPVDLDRLSRVVRELAGR